MRKVAMLRAIQAFEAAARSGSYVEAAVELNVTAAAIGQQVRALEAWLEMPLFHRMSSGGNRLLLTDAAHAALPEFKEGLDRLDAGLRLLRRHEQRARVVVSASQSFVARWLLPRLETFTARHPEIDVHLNVSDRLVDIEHGEADIGIRCGLGQWPAVEKIKLMDEEVMPVCSPSILAHGKTPRDTAEIARMTLIHDTSMKETDAFPSWQSWCSRYGLDEPLAQNGLRIDSSAAVIQAVLDGQGVALVRRAFVAEELKSKQLIRLLPQTTWPIAWAYFVVHGKDALAIPAVNAFMQWIKSAVDGDGSNLHNPKGPQPEKSAQTTNHPVS